MLHFSHETRLYTPTTWTAGRVKKKGGNLSSRPNRWDLNLQPLGPEPNNQISQPPHGAGLVVKVVWGCNGGFMDELLCRKTILLQCPWPSSWIRTNYKWHRLSRCQLSSLAFLQRFLAVAWPPLDNSPQCLLTTCNRRHLLDPHLPFWPVASSPRSYAVCERLGHYIQPSVLSYLTL